MAKVHKFFLTDPFLSLEVLELDALEKHDDGSEVGVKRLYLLDPKTKGGLRLIKSQPVYSWMPPQNVGSVGAANEVAK